VFGVAPVAFPLKLLCFGWPLLCFRGSDCVWDGPCCFSVEIVFGVAFVVFFHGTYVCSMVSLVFSQWKVLCLGWPVLSFRRKDCVLDGLCCFFVGSDCVWDGLYCFFRGNYCVWDGLCCFFSLEIIVFWMASAVLFR